MAAKLTGKSLAAFTEVLAAKEPVPGGGGAAAAAGALGAALCIMVGNYTVGKKKYAAYEADVLRIKDEAERLRVELIRLVDADAEAFTPLSQAYAIPKEDPKRQQVLEEATIGAAKAPAAMARCAARTVDLLEEMLEKGSVMLLSDVGCGAVLCRAALESAAMNVFINTKTMQDRKLADELEQEMDQLLSEYTAKAAKIAEAVSVRIRD
ncbi:MAG: cyclodeaminase/cyclohydrolase family protein [Eubacterium sp.]|nr:cyclodeaminase/cyclohydrolase family protein [Eubacterium sp.]